MDISSFQDILDVLMDIAAKANQLGHEAHEFSAHEDAGKFARARDIIVETQLRLKHDVEDTYSSGPMQIVVCRKSGFSNMVILIKETAAGGTWAELAEEQEVNELVAASPNPAEELNEEYFRTETPTGIPYDGMEDGPSW